MRGVDLQIYARGVRPTEHQDVVPPETPPPQLSPGVILQLAETHLADLAETQRPHASRLAPRGGLKEKGRNASWWLHRQAARAGIALEAGRRAYRSPRRRLGRLRTRLRVADWRAFWHFGVLAASFTLLVFIFDILWVRFSVDLFVSSDRVFGAEDESAKQTMRTVSEVVAAVTGLSAAAAIALLWNDFFRCPWAAWRMRRRIAKRPVSILPTAPPKIRRRRDVGEDDPLEGQLIPRDELFDEVLPGILRRHRRDVQVVVGEPGSGKTTALIGTARLVARVGMVPVFVPLRGEIVDDILQRAERAFEQQVRTHAGTTADHKPLWRWLCARRRVVVLVDDADQIAAHGERGYVLRQTLERLATRDVAVLATARPAGIPAGVAASSIDLGELDPKSVVRYVAGEARKHPEARASAISERELRRWVDEGRLAEIPFYLELLASLHAAGRCRELPPASTLHDEGERSGRLRRLADGTWQLNPLWVRFRLLEAYYEGIADGTVKQGLGLELVERQSSLMLLEDAALTDLRAGARQAIERAKAIEEERGVAGASKVAATERASLQELIDSNDRRHLENGRRTQVSAHEAIDTGERLRVLARDDAGRLQFRHRIMQAYLAGRRLVRYSEDEPAPTEETLAKPVRELLDLHNPEKLTTHMALTFAALHAKDRVRREQDDVRDAHAARERREVATAIRKVTVSQLLDGADELLTGFGMANVNQGLSVATDPAQAGDPELRIDPDGALINLTTAATIVHALQDAADHDATGGEAGADIVLSLQAHGGATAWVRRLDPAHLAAATSRDEDAQRIAETVGRADGATRWTKLNAIAAIAELDADDRWTRLWDYARDSDYRVRRAACKELQRSAFDAYHHLANRIEGLIVRAAARSALNLPIATPSNDATDDPSAPMVGNGIKLRPIDRWTRVDVLSLIALGWVLPAIVSGLREDPYEEDRRGPDKQRLYAVHDARHALETIVTLAFEGGHSDFESSVAQGFKDDAMRHAENSGGRISGPGWVASNRRLVAEIALEHAESWYSRMLLYQALALYAIAGANRRDTHEIFARMLDPARETHAFVRRAAKLARRAVERKQVGSNRWTGLIWNDEDTVVGRRASVLDDVASQLAADVTLLLNLHERSPEDRQLQFGHMHDLPHCLVGSKDRNEILGAGCPATCGWGLCPYKQPPPDEPNAHRGVSRAFCRQQQQLARRWRRAPWAHKIRRRKLERFWREMERRART